MRPHPAEPGLLLGGVDPLAEPLGADADESATF
jgi:hypothetical protein